MYAKMVTMQIRMDEKMVKGMDSFVDCGVYPSRSEFVRDAVRRMLVSK